MSDDDDTTIRAKRRQYEFIDRLRTQDPAQGSYIRNLRTGETFKPGMEVKVVKAPHWNGNPRDEILEGGFYFVYDVFSDPVVSLSTTPPPIRREDRSFNDGTVVELDCVTTLIEPTEEELAAALKSLGVQP